jgi:hypothetical protein
LILIAVLGQGTGKVIAALVTVQWAYYARTVRGAALVEKRKEYIEAAHCLALSPSRIVFRHLLPNCLPPMIVVATVQVAAAIALEATLSFLGLGLPITEPSLGLLIANGYQYLLSGKYWISFFPGIALLCTIVSINLVADQLRDVLESEIAAMNGSVPLLEVTSLRTHFFTRGGRREGGGRRVVRRAEGRSDGSGRRIGLGQVDDRLFDHGPRRSAGPHRRRHDSPRRPRSPRAFAGGIAAASRQRDRDDLPGPDDDAQPVLSVAAQMIEDDRRARQCEPARALGALARGAREGRHSVAR